MIIIGSSIVYIAMKVVFHKRLGKIIYIIVASFECLAFAINK